MKKTSKIIVALCIILAIVMISVSSFANGDPFSPKDLGNGKVTTEQANTLQTMGGQIIGVVRTVGIIVAVVILLVLGIKYMMGSAEEKADYKKSMIPYIVGAVLIFAGSTIAGIVYDMANALNNGQE